MVTLRPASVVVIPFPFSDLSASKLRPAVVLKVLAATIRALQANIPG